MKWKKSVLIEIKGKDGGKGTSSEYCGIFDSGRAGLQHSAVEWQQLWDHKPGLKSLPNPDHHPIPSQSVPNGSEYPSSEYPSMEVM